MHVAILVGTRPEIIKMSPIVRACAAQDVPYSILHTGQHYTASMDAVFFEQLGLTPPRANLEVGSGPHGAQTGKMLGAIEQTLLDWRPDLLLVQGDTNSVLAGALAAAKLHVPCGHVEAGLRSRDRKMPEEINRVVADHICDLLLAPTNEAAQNLRAEGRPESAIFVTGNTIVDAAFQNLARAEGAVDPLRELSIEPDRFVLATLHRAETVDDPTRMGAALRSLEAIGRALGMPVVYPVHPRARDIVDKETFDRAIVRCVEPLDFMRFLVLEKHAHLAVTDSGGVQEETCILGTPCLTLRTTTERPETIDVGANMLAEPGAPETVDKALEMAGRPRAWDNPFGDGTAGEQIVQIALGHGRV